MAKTDAPSSKTANTFGGEFQQPPAAVICVVSPSMLDAHFSYVAVGSWHSATLTVRAFPGSQVIQPFFRSAFRWQAAPLGDANRNRFAMSLTVVG